MSHPAGVNQPQGLPLGVAPQATLRVKPPLGAGGRPKTQNGQRIFFYFTRPQEMTESRLLCILYDQRVLLPCWICRLVCKAWNDVIDGHKEVVVVERLQYGGTVLGQFLQKLPCLRVIHFDRQFRKTHCSEIIDGSSQEMKVSDAGQDKRKVPITLREREEEKILGAFRALSLCHPLELSLTFCRLSHQDIEALLNVLATQVLQPLAQKQARSKPSPPPPPPPPPPQSATGRGIEALDLSGNFFGPEGVRPLLAPAAAASALRCLTALNVSDNDLGARGISELAGLEPP